MVRTKTRPPSGLVLTHGAGGDSNHATLVAIDEALAPLPTHRFDFPYRKKPGRRPPDRAPKLIQSIRDEAASFAQKRGLEASSLVLGGRSMGGRMCSMAVADGMPAVGLVLLSYPLHPPGKPEKLRTEHFADVKVPCLFIMGDKDPFGRPDEFDAHLGAISGPVTVVWLERANHSPKPEHDATIVEAVRTFVQTIGG